MSILLSIIRVDASDVDRRDYCVVEIRRGRQLGSGE